MEIVKSYDSRMSDIWCVEDGLKTVAICYSEKEAEVCKNALEQYKAEKEREESNWWWF